MQRDRGLHQFSLSPSLSPPLSLCFSPSPSPSISLGENAVDGSAGIVAFRLWYAIRLLPQPTHREVTPKFCCVCVCVCIWRTCPISYARVWERWNKQGGGGGGGEKAYVEGWAGLSPCAPPISQKLKLFRLSKPTLSLTALTTHQALQNKRRDRGERVSSSDDTSTQREEVSRTGGRKEKERGCGCQSCKGPKVDPFRNNKWRARHNPRRHGRVGSTTSGSQGVVREVEGNAEARTQLLVLLGCYADTKVHKDRWAEDPRNILRVLGIYFPCWGYIHASQSEPERGRSLTLVSPVDE